MSVESPKKNRLPILTSLSSIFRSPKTSRRPSKGINEPIPPISTRDSLKTEEKSEAQSDHVKTPDRLPAQDLGQIHQKKKNVMFSDECEYEPALLKKSQSKDSTQDVKPGRTKGILVRKRLYSQQIEQPSPTLKNPASGAQNWVGLLNPDDYDEEDDEKQENEPKILSPGLPKSTNGLKLVFPQPHVRKRGDSIDTIKSENNTSSDTIDGVNSSLKASPSSKKLAPSIFKPTLPKETLELFKESYSTPKKGETTPVKDNGDLRPHFSTRTPHPQFNDHKGPSFNVSDKGEDQGSHKMFNIGILPELKLNRDSSSSKIKTDRIEYDRPSFLESPFRNPSNAGKAPSGYENSRSNFSLAASSILNSEQYHPIVYQNPGVQRRIIVTNYQGSLPPSHAGTPRKV